MQLRGWSRVAYGLFTAILLMGLLVTSRVWSTEYDYMAGYTGAEAELTGSATCVMCHQDRIPENLLSHIALLDDNPDCEMYGYGCEGCHGPGGEHNGNPAGILNLPMMPIDDLTMQCSMCHDSLGDYDMDNYRMSDHFYMDISCLECHGGHSDNEGFLTEADELDLCYNCHAEKRAEFSMRSHHPIENDGNCRMCHNPHSGEFESQLIEDRDELCFSCHPDKEGPFVYDHDVSMDSAGDGCLTCHVSHGTNYDNLLTLPSRLCQQCHTEVGPDVHYAGTCWSSGCHTEVHGSNSHPLYFY